MVIPLGVLTIYVSLLIWAGLLINGFRVGAWRPFLLFGVAILLFLNIGYFVNGAPYAISSFIGIYDVLDNLGVDPGIGAPALASCPGNTCSTWGDTFTLHPSWGVSFYDRFANGDGFRTNLLYGHIGFNTIAFVLMHVQLFRPGYGARKASHGWVGRVIFVAVILSTICAVWLASQHGPVESYGGSWSTWGFYSMSAVVCSCLLMSVLFARRGDAARHRVWAFRFIGSMWGAFWIFRVMLFVLGPLLREWDAAALLACIWLSAPLGVVVAEVVRRRLDGRPVAASGFRPRSVT